MFDIGMTELLLIGFVALIVVGPKDLPGMFRTLGQFTAKARRMAREFSSAMEAAADEAGVKDVTNTIKAASNPKKMGLDAVKKAASFDKLDENSETAKLAKDRAEASARIKAKAAEMREAKANGAAETQAAANEAAAKPAVKKTAEKKAPAKKPTAKKPAVKPSATKPAAKPATKPIARKTAAKTAPKTVAQKTPTKKAPAKRAAKPKKADG